MRTMSNLRLQTYRSTEPPRPTNVDESFRHHEGDGRLDPYYGSQSKQESVPLAAFCFLAMVGLLMWIGGYQIAAWAFGW